MFWFPGRLANQQGRRSVQGKTGDGREGKEAARVTGTPARESVEGDSWVEAEGILIGGGEMQMGKIGRRIGQGRRMEVAFLPLTYHFV